MHSWPEGSCHRIELIVLYEEEDTIGDGTNQGVAPLPQAIPFLQGSVCAEIAMRIQIS